MKNKIFIAVIMFLASVSLSGVAHASTPTLSLIYTGSGDNVLVGVTGDPNSSVTLNYQGTSGSVLFSIIGTTNSTGILSTTLSTSAYGISPTNNLVKVTVNGQQSSSMTWPYSSGVSTGSTISLSQTSVTLSVSQTAIITASNNGSNSLYLSGNTSPSVANISLNSNQVTATANMAGSTSVTVCAVGNSSNCATFSVTVQGATQVLLFSQNNLSITVGQTVPVTVAGGTGTYVVSNNSNPNAIQTNVNGSTVNFYANTSSGSASVTVCSSDSSACGVINAAATGVTGSSAISFSQTNPAISVGQTVSVTVSGSTGNYYVSSNSAPSIVQTNIVGSTLTLFGNSSGSATISVCSSGGGCGVMVAIVGATNAGITLSQTSITLSAGQASTVTISGAGGYYVSSNSNQSAASAAISGNNVTISAISAGTANITICQSSGQCAALYVTVSGTTAASSGSIVLNQMLAIGQSVNLSISGGSTPYYLSSNAGNIFGAVLNGSTLTLSGVGAGLSSINVCSSNGTCATVYVSVSGSSGGSTAASDAAAVITSQIQALQNQIAQIQGGSTAAGSYKFLNPIKLGDKNAEVTELQKRLTTEGVYSGPITGLYGPLTEAAVKKYQTQHGLTPLGNVGPGTRASLNQ